MLNDSLAPIGRAFAFFGIMAAVVVALTLGAGLQDAGGESSAAVAMAKARQAPPAQTQVAAVKHDDTVASPARRAIPSSQEARLSVRERTVLR